MSDGLLIHVKEVNFVSYFYKLTCPIWEPYLVIIITINIIIVLLLLLYYSYINYSTKKCTI